MNNKLICILFIIIFAGEFVFSQKSYDKKFLDSLYSEFVQLKSGFKTEGLDLPLRLEEEKHKCGLFLINFVKQNLELFSPEQQQAISSITGRPSVPFSINSPSGRFKIHYDTASTERPKYLSTLSISENLALIASAIDSVYNFEVNFLGYPPPPADFGSGGDDKYDIYIVNLGGGLYGYTESEAGLGNQRFTSFMVIDNDYAGYYSSGINGARVTLAHEFHHGIQMGNYILRFDDTYFYEITSTSMEEFVFDDINDYYAYMPSYFNNPQRAFAENDGYNLAVWNLYLKETFGFDIIKRQWQLMPAQRAMNAINTSLNELNTSFKHELNQFGIWTHYTKHRAVPGRFFEEASKYPIIKPLSTIIFTSPEKTVSINSKATANNFIRFVNQQSGKNDSIYVLITNGDVNGAVNNINQLYSFTYSLFDTAVPGTNQINQNYFSKFSTESPFLWSITEILDTTVKILDPQRKTSYPYPMPYSYKKYSEHTPIKIPVSSENSTTVGLYIYTTSMELIYSNGEMPRSVNNKNEINWRVRNNDGKKLASGVYIYVIKDGDEVQKGKLVILHE